MNATIDCSVLRPCPLCGSALSALVFETIRRCKKCGLSFVSPLGDYRGEHETAEYFLNDYLPLHESNRENSLAERRAHLAMIRRHFRLPARPRLLDVGCALGFMLHEAQAAGWDAAGVETSDFAARYARESTGCPVYTGTLQQAALEDESFDVVTLMDVIEHVAEPRYLMDEIYRVLRPEGVLFIVTPNFASLFVRLYGSEAYGIGPEEHVVYFRPGTLERLLQETGFRRIVTQSRDLYAENLRRLLGRKESDAQAKIKTAFGKQTWLGAIRRSMNCLFMYVPLGDKLIALAQK
jgi:SAM-dependent methyltransferase